MATLALSFFFINKLSVFYNSVQFDAIRKDNSIIIHNTIMNKSNISIIIVN